MNCNQCNEPAHKYYIGKTLIGWICKACCRFIALTWPDDAMVIGPDELIRILGDRP